MLFFSLMTSRGQKISLTETEKQKKTRKNKVKPSAGAAYELHLAFTFTQRNTKGQKFKKMLDQKQSSYNEGVRQ